MTTLIQVRVWNPGSSRRLHDGEFTLLFAYRAHPQTADRAVSVTLDSYCDDQTQPGESRPPLSHIEAAYRMTAKDWHKYSLGSLEILEPDVIVDLWPDEEEENDEED